MDMQEQHERGLKLREAMFGREAVAQRSNAFGEFGKPLQHIINAYAYGDVWSRTVLPPAVKSLTMIAMMAAAGHANELRVHLKGALKNGCKAEEIQEVLLLLDDVLRHPGRERGASRGGRGSPRSGTRYELQCSCESDNGALKRTAFRARECAPNGGSHVTRLTVDRRRVIVAGSALVAASCDRGVRQWRARACRRPARRHAKIPRRASSRTSARPRRLRGTARSGAAGIISAWAASSSRACGSSR